MVFSKTQPELVSPEIIDKLMPADITVSEKATKLSDFMGYVYTNLVAPNMFVIFIGIAVLIFISISWALNDTIRHDLELESLSTE